MYSRLVPESSQPYHQQAVIYNRPSRVCYVVNSSTDHSVIMGVVRFNSTLWGGRYNLFIPFDGEIIRSDWWHVLIQYDPDYVIYVGTITADIDLLILSNIQPLNRIRWDIELTDLYKGIKLLPFKAITVKNLFKHWYETEGVAPQEKSRAVLPEVVEGKYSSLFESSFGTLLTEPEKQDYQAVLGAQRILCKAETFDDYLKIHTKIKSNYYPLQFTSNYLNIIYDNMLTDLALIISDGDIADLFLLHMLGWYDNSTTFSGSVLLVLMDDLSDPINLNLLSDWLTQVGMRTNYLSLRSASLGLEKLREVREMLRPKLEGRFATIDIYSCVNIPKLTYYSEKQQQLVMFQNDTVSFAIPSLNIISSITNQNGWIVEVDLSSPGEKKTGFDPTRFIDLRFTIDGKHELMRKLYYQAPSRWRISRGYLAAVVRQHEQIITSYLPPAQALFTNLLKGYEFSSSIDEKGRYYKGMLKLAGGLRGLHILQNPHFTRLFENKILRKGSALSIKAITSEARPGKSEEVAKFKDEFQAHVGKQIFLRCYAIRCPECGYETIYNVGELAEEMLCKGCRSKFQPPVEMPFTYRLNELFIRGFEQGAKTVLLTALLLEQASKNSFIWDAGYKISGNSYEDGIDIDLIAMCDGLLVMVECKDSLTHTEDTHIHAYEKYIKRPAHTISDYRRQFERSIELAKQINADFFFVAVSEKLETIPSEIIDFLVYKNKSDNKLVVGIISQSDLTRGYFIKVEDPEKRVLLTELKKLYPPYPDACAERDPLSGGTFRLTVF